MCSDSYHATHFLKVAYQHSDTAFEIRKLANGNIHIETASSKCSVGPASVRSIPVYSS